mmetsp:Transcript_2942/g.5885  ORF Transcript_2942/g.5885 Transcript_2942/m.5885 type:complete len:82 (+) Transcript_2942:181-426(+)
MNAEHSLASCLAHYSFSVLSLLVNYTSEYTCTEEVFNSDTMDDFFICDRFNVLFSRLQQPPRVANSQHRVLGSTYNSPFLR